MSGVIRLCLGSLTVLFGTMVWGGDSGLVAHLTVEDGTGTVVRDRSGNGNDAQVRTRSGVSRRQQGSRPCHD